MMTYKVYNKLPKDAVMIRKAVFTEEQGFLQEFDEADENALHIVGYADDGSPVSVGRIMTGEAGEFIFGRLAVMKKYRGKALGSQILTEAERIIRTMGGSSVKLHSQCRAADFYRKCGYTEFGDIDDDEGVPHIWMRKKI